MNTLAIFARRNNKKLCEPDLIPARKIRQKTSEILFITAPLKIKIQQKTSRYKEVVSQININTPDIRRYKTACVKKVFLIQTRTIPDKISENIK